jgi:hypothetical protein
VKTSDDAGMGNRLQAIVSAYLFAIVTKRVLLIDWAENSNQMVLLVITAMRIFIFEALLFVGNTVFTFSLYRNCHPLKYRICPRLTPYLLLHIRGC